MKESLFVSRRAVTSIAVLFSALLGVLSVAASVVFAASGAAAQRVSFDESVIVVDGSEPSYVQYAAKDLAGYLAEITGKPVRVSISADEVGRAKSVILRVRRFVFTACRLEPSSPDRRSTLARRSSDQPPKGRVLS